MEDPIKDYADRIFENDGDGPQIILTKEELTQYLRTAVEQYGEGGQFQREVSPPAKDTATSIYNYALVRIAIKSTCDCWEMYGIGSNIAPKWIGCKAHNSDDPNEYCFTCIANEALLRAAK